MKIKLTEDVSYILGTLIENGYEAYIVGGCVRDSIIKKQLKDWDITTNAKPDDILRLFEKTIPTGIKHGTVTIVLNKNNYEVTTYRIDGDYSDNRHPDQVIFTSSLREDLSRRDFTVNALAYNDIDGLVDMFHGIDDLHSSLIKCVGDPDKRFNEDALRMLRAIRFSCQLDFNIEEETYKSISKNSYLLKNVSSERIRDEFCKMLLTSKPSRGIKMLLETRLIDYIVPELKESVGFDQKNPHHDKNVFDHIMSVLDNSEENLIVRLGALLHDIGKPRTFTIDKKGIGHFYGHNVVSAQMAEEILKRLRFDNKTMEKVIIIITEHMTAYNHMKNRTLKKFISRVGVDNLEDLFQLQIADSKGHKKDADFSPIIRRREEVKKILESGEPFTVSQLKINGNDLIALGFKPGKYIGTILNELLEKVMEKPELNNRDSLLKIAADELKKGNEHE
ncbi:HDIG domain protein [Clostridiales bacterium oral taxon 876 str. F0540]|nr:HDIG domain protein [Clostridiales bacterium oral taxon 876 str. F0540]